MNFCQQYDIPIVMQRVKRAKRMADELCCDERSSEMTVQFRRDVFIHVVDVIQTQLQERFGDESVALMKEIVLFSSENMCSEAEVSAKNISSLCRLYGLDPDIVALKDMFPCLIC
jgi:hypothetical protein